MLSYKQVNLTSSYGKYIYLCIYIERYLNERWIVWHLCYLALAAYFILGQEQVSSPAMCQPQDWEKVSSAQKQSNIETKTDNYILVKHFLLQRKTEDWNRANSSLIFLRNQPHTIKMSTLTYTDFNQLAFWTTLEYKRNIFKHEEAVKTVCICYNATSFSRPSYTPGC